MHQDYFFLPIRAAVILTTGFVAGDVDITRLNASPLIRNQVNFLLDFTIGSLTSLDIKIEYSDDGSDWYQETFETITDDAAAMSLGLYNFTATGKYVISVPVKSANIRISAKGNGTVTSSSLKIGAMIGTV